MSPIRTMFAMLVAMLCLTPVAARAATGAVAEAAATRVTEGTLLFRGGDGAAVPAPLLETDVDLRVTGPVARAIVRQQFVNPTSDWVEGVYVFPLPEDAAVDHLRLHVGDRVLEGVIRERAAAKATYEQAKREGRRTGLVEQERANIFTTSVANIAPGASVAVEIEYQQTLRWDDGRYRLRVPLVVGPRYIPGAPVATPPDAAGWSPNTDVVPDASRITPPVVHPSRGPINPVTLRVTLAPGAPLSRLDSTYHAIHATPGPDGTYRIELGAGLVPADRDFELVWETAAGTIPAAAVFTEGRDDGVYGLLVVTPPSPAADAARRQPREVVFVIDNSGSMAGASIEQAKAALQLALARLGPADMFNVIRFNHTMDAVFETPRPATREHVALAARWVERLRATGGTEMRPPLMRALEGGEGDGRLRQVIFLTDGGVGNEAELFEIIHKLLGDRRLFTVGIGSAPNSHFMRGAARYGRGTFTYIGAVSEVQEKMTALFRKLEAPALTDLRLELPGIAAAEVLPDPVPDLYIGEPVVVAFRAATLPAHAVLRGRFGATTWEREVSLQRAPEHAGLATHWARAKIGALLDGRRGGADDDGVRQAVIQEALAHHLVSPYTSLVAVDVTPVRPEDAALQSHAMPTNLPHGWDYEAVFGLGQGATDARLHAIAGLVVLIIATALAIALRPRHAAETPR
ncbi:MAG: marine proteobacterial sortase target protein [Candidatus Rokuibacteriota bacterium]|nr:MAG: marine proteobacterial sortase target protein [Candidatus Rokubacteria bacterium]